MTVSSLSSLAAGINRSLTNQNSRVANTVAALVSGRRLTQASADVAALSASVSLQNQVTGLRAASLNVSQAQSLLQVADGAAAQIGDALQRAAQISAQANNGSLTGAQRNQLNQEFQNITREINRLAGNTNFNGVNLIDGSLAGGGVSANATQSARASGALQFNANVAGGQTINLNGVSLVAGTDFAVGTSAAQTVQNLANALNADSRFAGFNFSASASQLGIEAEAGGSAGNQFTINQAASTAGGAFTVAGNALTGAGVFSLQGGNDAGLSAGDTTAVGTVGNNLLTGLNNQAATSQLSFTSASDIVAGNTIQIDNGEGGFTTFTFVNGAPASATDIQIGSTLEATLNNAASTLENFSGAGDFGTRQLNFSVQNGNQLVISSALPGNPTDVTGAALNVNLTSAGGSISATTLNNGSVGGIDVSNVTSAGFTGTIQGFTANFTGVPNQTQLSLQVGGDVFTATLSNSNSSANQTVTFTSANGGSFDVTFAGGNGDTINSQSDANGIANRLDAAFAGVSFNQTRDIAGFAGTGALAGATAQITGDDFSNLDVGNISVIASGGSSRIEVNVNGQVFRSADLATSIDAGERVTLVSSNGERITITNGQNRINLNNNADASALQANLRSSFGQGSGGNGLPFQVGANSDDRVNLSIGNLSAEALLGGNFNLQTQEGAQAAFAAVSGAINTLTSQRADVGALQEALNFAQGNLASAIQNQDAARSVLADTDFATASTESAQSRVQRQASIAVLAQSNRLPANILQLLND